MPPRLKKPKPGEEIRLSSLDILRRKVRAIQGMAADQITAVFNESEIAIIKRLAKGETVRGVEMTQAEAARQLRRIALGGWWGYDDGDARRLSRAAKAAKAKDRSVTHA